MGWSVENKTKVLNPKWFTDSNNDKEIQCRFRPYHGNY